MDKEDKGITRRQWIQTSSRLALAGLLPGELLAQAKEKPAPSKKTGTRLILLGNGGGPRPNKMRAQSAWVVMINDVPYVVDCGGGVSRQMVFANIPLKSLRYIFITHHHSDHNLEYGSLMYNAWVTGFKGRIDTYGPPPIEKITSLFLEMNAYDINIRIPDEGRPPLKPMIFVHEFSKGGLVMENDQVKVTAALVNHPPVVPAFAYRFDSPDRSIVFSGDTTPCDNLIKLAQGADILVHEVIHKPSLARLLARIPNADRLLEHIVASHTTHVDVGKVAKEAGVKTLVLTHFVPVDDPTEKEEMWIEGARTHFDGKIIVGKDLLEI
ncbi:MAG: MBL fold metallo-hydrolase [Deltaproteobacteria bacterium]|nr:MBL fold metallo-hydrolase [Deltaproteobacteria bacterium]